MTISPDGVEVCRIETDAEGCITLSRAADLSLKVESALRDPQIHAVVLTGASVGVFIRHAQIGEIDKAARAVASGRIDSSAFVGTPFWNLVRTLETAEKPVIAAIDGICMGGGLEIAAACTMRVCSPTTGPIGLPEIRVGIFPGLGGVHRLARLIGWQKARVLALTGRLLDGEQAFAMGIVDALAPDPISEALEIAAGLAGREPAAVAALLRVTKFEADRDAIDASMEAFGTILGEESVRARMAAFMAGDRGLHELK